MKRFFLRLLGYRDYAFIGTFLNGKQFNINFFNRPNYKTAYLELEEYFQKNGITDAYLTSVNRF